MDLGTKTVKELQRMCKDAKLKVTGNKKTLIERLEFQSAHNTINQELMQRVRELETTVLRLEQQPTNYSMEEESGNVVSDPRTDGFVPKVVSSPRPEQMMNRNEANVQENVLPIVTEDIRLPVKMADRPACSVTFSAPQFINLANAPHLNHISTPQYTHVTNTAHVGYTGAPQYTHVTNTAHVGYTGAPQYTHATNGRQLNYTNIPQHSSTVGVPHATQYPNTQHIANPSAAVAYAEMPATFVAAPVTNVGATMNVKDIMMVLPEFDPTAEDSLTSGQFVQRVQTLMNAYQWPDDLVVFSAQQKLRGYAKYWVDSNHVVFRTWQHFANKLIEIFPFNDNAADAHIKMANTKRGYAESPQEYYYRMLSLGTKYRMTESAIARHIINGINESDLKRKISNDYTSCVALLRDIESFCSFNEIRYQKYSKTFSDFQPIQMRERKPTYKPPEQHTDRNIRCYNCSNYGHMAAKCPQPQRLPRCQNCRKHHQPTVACASVTPVSKVKAVTSKTLPKPELMKVVEINGLSIQAMVDSGSDRTLIRKSVLERMGTTKKCNIIMNGFGGGQYISTQSKDVTLMMDGVTYNINVLEVEDEALDADILLGRDVLCQQGTRVIIENQNCWVENVDAAMSGVSELQLNEREKLKNILAEHRDCFAETVQELGTCTVKQMEIKLTTDVPVNVKPYRVAFAKREEARTILNELLCANIIEHSDSPCASPVVLVPKNDGSLRLCVDYRLLNRITVKIPFPMPIMEEQFAQLAGNRYFTTMDLRMGYHQVELDAKSREYTGFVTMGGHYQYTRMPFGLVNAPAIFQEIMNKLASKLPSGEVLVYLDDVVIPSRTVKEGLEQLTKFLKVLRGAGLTLRLDKCHFLSTEITYLGHTINAEGITPGNVKVSAIKNFKTPTSVTEVRRFLGLTGFFRKFIPNYAEIVNPLTKLLHKSEAGKFEWGELQNDNFKKLIELLSQKPVLTLYDFTAHHEVHTNASSVGLAGVLLQSHDERSWRAVFYFSRHCTDAEKRYHSYELEVLAAVETLTRFRVYLLGKPFRLVTDCSAIAKAKTQKELIPKIARWYMRLMEFDFDIVHRPGARLAHVDALSRAPAEPASSVETAGFVYRVTIDSNDWLYTMQLQDKWLKHLILVLRGEMKDEQESQYKKEYQLKENRLYRKDDGLKFVVPKSVRWRIVKTCHDDAGHFGVDKTVARIKQTFWFPRIRKYVREYIDSCIDCCYAKVRGGKAEGQMHMSEVEPTPFATLHIDHLGPFIKSARGMNYVLAVSDNFSKYLIVKAVRNTKSTPVITALLEITTYFGLPKIIITDRGTAFTAAAFAKFCETNCVQHIKNAVRTPRANGQVERANQIILNSLRTATGRPQDWDLQLRNIQWAVNSQRNATTKYTPNELIFDYNLRDLTHNKMIAALHDDEPEESAQQSMYEKRQQAVENIAKERQKWKERFDKRHANPTVYDVDELVLIAHEPSATGESRKLEPKYKGPYIIAKSLGNDRYLVTDIPGLQLTQKPFESVFATDKLKKWCHSSPELDENSICESDSESELEDETQSGRAELSGATLSHNI